MVNSSNLFYLGGQNTNFSLNASMAVLEARSYRPRAKDLGLDTLDLGRLEWVFLHGTPANMVVEATTATSSTPPPRQNHVAVTIGSGSSSQRMVIYGGWNGQVPLNDVWTYNAGALSEYGTPNGGRYVRTAMGS